MENQSIQCCYFSEDFLFKEILPKAPTKSIIRFKSVSKSWLARITTDSAFIADQAAHRSTTADHCHIIQPSVYPTKHRLAFSLFFLGHGGSTKLIEIDKLYSLLNKPQQGMHSLRLQGACNGLLCLKLRSCDGSDDVVIWNPVTGESKRLAQPTLPPLPEHYSQHHRLDQYYFGFGRDINDYKIVRLEHNGRYHETTIIDVQLFTKSSGCWKQLNGFSGFMLMPSQLQGVTVDGTMHWAISYGRRNHKPVVRVLSFNLDTEEFQEFEAPPLPSAFTAMELFEWNGYLGALVVGSSWAELQLWLGAKTHDHRDGKNSDCLYWSKMTTIDPSLCPLYFFGTLRNKFILKRHGSHNSLLYDLTSYDTEEFKEDFGGWKFYTVFEHVHTLISPT